MPYKLHDYYAYCREFTNKKTFVVRIILTDIYSILCGFLIFFIFYFCEGAMNSSGQVFGMYTYGVYSVAAAVIIHHI